MGTSVACGLRLAFAADCEAHPTLIDEQSSAVKIGNAKARLFMARRFMARLFMAQH
jgi:hypothetical protein